MTIRNRRRPVRIRFGSSAKLVLLTVLFVMLAEVRIFVPSIARYRLNWLENKLSAASTAALFSMPCRKRRQAPAEPAELV
jgi:uncharacterized protein YhdP